MRPSLLSMYWVVTVGTSVGFGDIVPGNTEDNGGEFTGRRFTARLEHLGITHYRIPARSPNRNAVTERFHQTMLEECWRPAFHRRLFTSIHQLQAQANAWLASYTDRPNHGNLMAGRTPNQLLNHHQA